MKVRRHKDSETDRQMEIFQLLIAAQRFPAARLKPGPKNSIRVSHGSAASRVYMSKENWDWTSVISHLLRF